ncbi:AAA family ATPase [Pelodictyon luteolum]|uniref:DUF3696 domain-containing protein n=1 Tax=Chlorobium luteolum (strain DSM 273 / BCRC 81028 / 2530) TaxID=319225 RepID=Q3B1R0_CHLL3|nr:AAA family ATPase [Pelodictyon luteolum]ABB24721.1 conserved hypothetical protein [Pelodictyon luteolum DSM 273]
MFDLLRLKHFKAWRQSISIELKPLTVFLGTNSSGKSSIFQALLLLKQTVVSPDRTVHLNLGGNEVSDYFNFGHFDDVMSRNASSNRFDIGFEFHKNGNVDRQESPAAWVQNGAFSASYGKTSLKAAVVQEMSISGEDVLFRLVRRDRGAYSAFVGQEPQPRGKSRLYAPQRSIALSPEAVSLLGVDGKKAEDISLAIRRQIESITYLGPLRRKPERDYVWNGTMPGDIGIDGSRVVDVLLSSALAPAKDEGKGAIIESVSHWLNRMGVADSIEVRQLGRSTRYEIVVHRDGVDANLRDVGIGVSQVLPVVTLAFFVPKGSTIILEEPEIHLHPLAQAVLSELFVEVSQQRQIQFLVETHSEHLFRRLQTMVARQVARENDCRLYFVERKGADAELVHLELDGYGRIGH